MRAGLDRADLFRRAAGSASELTTALRIAKARGYITPADYAAVDVVLDRSVTKTYVPSQGLPRVVGGLKSFDDIGHELFCAAVRCGLSSRTQVVGVADGGNGVFELLDATFSPLQFILDKSHLKQHLYETADAIGLRDAPRERWVDHVVTQCEQGNVHRARAALRRHRGRGKTRCDRLHGYLTRFSSSVHYDAYRKMGYPIGSGEIESGHRVIPQKRLKIPGACWHPDSINPMMSLRILRENGWWNDFWQTPTHGL